MKERPIIFNGEMVRAILDGRKTQTRRVVKVQPPMGLSENSKLVWMEHTKVLKKRNRLASVYSPGWYWSDDSSVHGAIDGPIKCPYGQPGDRLWVRETWAMSGYKRVEYRAFPADGSDFRSVSRWRPSIYMPREASRINLLVKNVRVERVQDITEEDSQAEGVNANQYYMADGTIDDIMSISAKDNFQYLWDSINEKRGFGWDKNPWVWCVEFERCE